MGPHSSLTELTPAPARPASWLTSWRYRSLGLVTLLVSWIVASGTSFAAAAGGIPPVQYGAPNGAATVINTALEGVAGTIRDILGVTALLAIVAAALVNHFVHDPRSKERAKEMVAAAVVGLLLAVFAPEIVNWIAAL